LSKIFKAAGIRLDTENTVTIDVPRFDQNAAESPAANAATRTQSEYDRILNQAQSEGARIIREAHVNAAQMREKAEAERERLREETYAKAHEEGFDEGYGKGAAEADLLKAEAHRLHEETLAEQKRTYAAIEPDMVDLTLSIVKKLLGDVADIHPQVIANLIRQGIAESTSTGALVIRISREDYETVAADKDALTAAAEGADIELVRDLSLAKSDCIIETVYGNIDCSLDRQYEAVKQNLRYIWNAAKPEA